MRVSEELVCIDLFRQNLVFTSLHLRSPFHVVPPFLWKKLTNESEGKPDVPSCDAAAPRTVFRINKCFLRSKQKLNIYFYLDHGWLKV